MSLREFHLALGAQFTEVNGAGVVAHYGDALAEHAALRASAVVIDLSCRSRLCLTGADRIEFLHGQITNDVKALAPGAGCYAALVNAKGKMQSDLNVWRLDNELLLDFEPGFGPTVTQRLEKFIVAADVQIVDAAPHFGLLTVQGPRAADAVLALGLFGESPHSPHPAFGHPLPIRWGEGRGEGFGLPQTPFQFVSIRDAMLGDIYVMNQPRTGTSGFDVFAPMDSLAAIADKLIAAARALGGRAAGWHALEWARVEAGIPRFGADMDDTNLPPEAGIETRAVSYTKGCYIGQEVIARVRTYGQAAKKLCGLRLAENLPALPQRGEKLFHGEREAGFITTAITSPALRANIALGYVRREANEAGAELKLRTATGESTARIVPLPFL
ncbi:MAG: aminomethyl transferase family protein [Verrucomicrobia bacterium]|nr:aminomethyl transferase family protein [Verrucomicrobiota bacterium]